MWAGDILEDFVMYGETTGEEPSASRELAQGSRLQSSEDTDAHVDERHLSHLPHASFGMFGRGRFSFTPLSAPVLKSELDGVPTSRLWNVLAAAALNLVIHIFETRVILWNSINRKIPTMDDTTIEFFVRTPTGREIFRRYQRRSNQHYGKRQDVLEGTRSVRGGHPEDLIDAMVDVSPELGAS